MPAVVFLAAAARSGRKLDGSSFERVCLAILETKQDGRSPVAPVCGTGAHMQTPPPLLCPSHAHILSV